MAVFLLFYHFQELIYRYDLYSTFFRFWSLGACILPRYEIVEFRRHRCPHFSAILLYQLMYLISREAIERSCDTERLLQELLCKGAVTKWLRILLRHLDHQFPIQPLHYFAILTHILDKTPSRLRSDICYLQELFFCDRKKRLKYSVVSSLRRRK